MVTSAPLYRVRTSQRLNIEVNLKFENIGVVYD